jgi:hypothetical protein
MEAKFLKGVASKQAVEPFTGAHQASVMAGGDLFLTA